MIKEQKWEKVEMKRKIILFTPNASANMKIGRFT